MNISESGIDLIASHEGLRLTAYPDPGTGGEPWTIGYGHTGGVSQDDTCTEEQAREWLKEDAQTAVRCVNQSVSGNLTQNQFDALCSFVFNLGCNALRNSTLLRCVNAGEDEQAAGEFGKWCHSNGKTLPGLVARRQAESELFLTA